MSKQEHHFTKTAKKREEVEVEEVVQDEEAQERKDRLDEDVDAILGEIDQVLEVNAQDFVDGFVQKGGE